MRELLGTHEVVIRTRFSYEDGTAGEVTLPYAPVFALALK